MATKKKRNKEGEGGRVKMRKKKNGFSLSEIGIFLVILTFLLIMIACFFVVLYLAPPALRASPISPFRFLAELPTCPLEEEKQKKNEKEKQIAFCNDMKKKNFLAYLPHSRLFNQESELKNALLIALLTNRTLIAPPAYTGEFVPYLHPPFLLRTLQRVELQTNNETNRNNYYNHYQHHYHNEGEGEGRLEEGGSGEWDVNEYKTKILPFSSFYSSKMLEENSVSPADFMVCFNKSLHLDDVKLAWDEEHRYYYQFTDGGGKSERFHQEVPLSSLSPSPSLPPPPRLLFLGTVFGTHRVNVSSSPKAFALKNQLDHDFRLGGPILDRLMDFFFWELDKRVGKREGWMVEGEAGGKGEWVKQRRNYVGIHFRAGDNDFAEKKEEEAQAIITRFLSLLCKEEKETNKTKFEEKKGKTGGRWENEGRKRGKRNNRPCISPHNLVIFLASDIPPSLSLPLFAPLLNLSSTTKLFTLFDFLPFLVRTPLPPLHDRSLSFSPLLSPFNSLFYHSFTGKGDKLPFGPQGSSPSYPNSFPFISTPPPPPFFSSLPFSPSPPPLPPPTIVFPQKNYFCPKKMSLERLFSSFLPIVDIMGSSRGIFFLGTRGSTASQAALKMHKYSSSPPSPSSGSSPPFPPPSPESPFGPPSDPSCLSSPSSCLFSSFSFSDYFDLQNMWLLPEVVPPKRRERRKIPFWR